MASPAPSWQLPLTAADVLGYVTPGATLLVGVVGFEYVTQRLIPVDAPLLAVLKDLVKRAVASDAWLPMFAVALGVIGTSYVPGHIVSSLAAFLVDRTLVYKGYGYPYALLLRIRQPSRELGAFSRASFFWLNFYLLLRYAALIFPGGFRWLSLSADTAGVVSCALVLIRIPFVVKPAGESGAWARLSKVSRKLLSGAAWFYDLASTLLAEPLSTRRSFNEAFIEKYRKLFSERFHLSPDTAETNNFWFSYAYVVEKSPRLAERLAHWMSMYVFARNLATAFWLAFVYCFIWSWWSGVTRVIVAEKISLWTLHIPALFFLASLALLVRYYYLFVCRFSKFVFRAFVFLSQNEQSATPAALAHAELA